jgi:purine-binding chemotaxis protein CheW
MNLDSFSDIAIRNGDGENESVLKRRARELSKPITKIKVEPGIEVLEFSIGTERFACGIECVRETRDLSGAVTPLYKVPHFITGILNVRGEILPIFDIADILQVEIKNRGDPKKIVIFGKDEFIFAVLVNEVHGIATIPLSGIRTNFAGFSDATSLHCIGLYGNGTLIVNMNAIVADRSTIDASVPREDVC